LSAERSTTVITRESAIEELDGLIRAMDGLRGHLHTDSAHIRWHQKVVRFLSRTFGQRSRAYQSFIRICWYFRGTRMVTIYEVDEPGMGRDRYDAHAYAEAQRIAHGVLMAARDELEEASDLTEVYHGKNTAPEASEIVAILNIAETKLRKVVRSTPTKEAEIQDCFENLLIGADIAYRREGPQISYSSKDYRPDFTVPSADLVIEIKLCTKREHEKERIAEINDDIVAYGTQWGNQLFVVYDVGTIRDVETFKGSLESNDSVLVRVVKH